MEQPDVLVLAARTSVVDAATITATVRGRWTLPILIGSPSADAPAVSAPRVTSSSALIARPYDITAIAPFALSGRTHPQPDAPVYVAGPIRVDQDG
ncbi:two-component system response regulator, partial [Mycobacterium sp. ITM-2017-0098]